ncbi:acyltransferase [Algoriphagus sp. H41]|uniref:Acyltransferase n=1 Tax=Algoriphagus oliviformis TaxID=2811231 RepID=A0ABS3C719_9BACT|nr:acyltransferase [Algoriphagus oliviformis]MBN7812915.1 acyltransferase [Algoriphagus oliviformis]
MNLIALFRRSTNSKSFIPEIDGLRFFSIATVALYHLNTAYSRQIGIGLEGWGEQVGIDHITQFGWWLIRMDLGVKVFFAISGFILGLPFLKYYFGDGKKVAIGDYLYRRLTRLEPPFVITLLGFYLVHVFLLGESAADLLPNFLTGLVYSHVFVFGLPNPINPVTWSLETEAQFYLVLPLLFFLLSKLRRPLLIFGAFLALLLASAYFRSYSLDYGLLHLSSSVFAYFINFGTGILFAYLYLKRPAFFAKTKTLGYDGLVMAAIVGMFVFYKPQALVYNNLLFNLSVLAFLVGTFRGKLANWLFTRPFVYLVGGMCYTIYLIHYAFFYLVVGFTGGISLGQGYWLDYFVQGVLIFPLLLVLSAAFFLLVEKPCMDKNWPSQLKHSLKTKLAG